MTEKGKGRPKGLTTTSALGKLRDDIECSIAEFEEEQKRRERTWQQGTWLYDAFHHNSGHSTFRWTSAVALLTEGVLLLVAYFSHDDARYETLPIETFFILLLLLSNILLVGWDSRQRYLEIPQCARHMLTKLKECIGRCRWSPENYPHLHSPLSPCITLQWTYRDGHLVNLPWALLVEGDTILLKSGQHVPGKCRPVDEKDGSELQAGDRFVPPVEGIREVFSIPKPRTPLRPRNFILQETPYVNNLQIALQEALNRPLSVFNKERYVITEQVLENIAVPVTVVCVFVINLIRYLYLSHWVAVGHWTEMFLLQPAATILPLLPLLWPAAWIVLNVGAVAWIVALFRGSRQLQVSVSPFEEVEVATPTLPTVHVQWKDIQHYFTDILLGNGGMPARSQNLVHVLGSVTALCCIDKKGILSWPNPTAEKVFFLKNSGQTPLSSRNSSSIFQSAPSLNRDRLVSGSERNLSESHFRDSDTERLLAPEHEQFGDTVPEVLDLTHDNTSPFRLQFDDPSWKQYLGSLKPLGLNILLNTCNLATQEPYTQFCSHITCEAMYNEDLVPVTNRRCLCELAKQIGFQDQAQDIFHLEQQLSTFRHVQGDMARKEKFARTLSTKLKFPFPHMVAVAVRELCSGSLQLMSQGTGDIILDSCVDFWDGGDVCPLTESDRKKVLDFYHRTSLTAYCTAFAYRPVNCCLEKNLGQVYLELPSDSSHLYPSCRSPTLPHWDIHNIENRMKCLLNLYHSTDSLLGHEARVMEVVSDMDGCFQLQCNQVFIGMVTMQYQAMIDTVHLIEQLDKACIRFVHFSKENELRSRVFSEKMGLESGWNCHISLLSEKSRTESSNSSGRAAPVLTQSGCKLSWTSLSKHHPSSDWHHEETSRLLPQQRSCNGACGLSASAPSAINLDVSQVKFEDEISLHSLSETEESEQAYEDRIQSDRDSSSRVYFLPEHGSNTKTSQNSISRDSVLMNSEDVIQPTAISRSLSHVTESTDQSAPVAFDMSNRAKLPRGIDKIRPHIEQVDNVPLLVSLFTDCTSAATLEMIKIMQDYGEVVCVMGSSANAENMHIFMQADASLAVEPLYPQVCQKVPVFLRMPENSGPPPVELSRMLNAVAAALSFKRPDSINLFFLIMESRRYMQNLSNCMQFWLCCCTSLSMVHVLSSLLLMPPPLTMGQTLWLACTTIPVLSLSLIFGPTDKQTMTKATGKNQCSINKEIILFVTWSYGAKFFPSLAVLLLGYGLILHSFCNEVTDGSTCWMYQVADNSSFIRMWGGWGSKYLYNWYIIQQGATFLLMLYFVTVSVSFVHRSYQLWQRNPLINRKWAAAVLIVMVLQAIYFTVGVAVVHQQEETSRRSGSVEDRVGLIHVPLCVWLITFLWPFCLLLINEYVKRHEIRVNVRYQKRTHLEFGTKLGMNSPF